MPVIEARHLTVDYRIGKRWLNALHDIDLAIQPLQIHGLVGESGSGKSTLGMSMMHYLSSNASIRGGEILFDDRDLAQLSPAAMRQIHGRLIGFVPQNPLDSLNPSLTIGSQMAEMTQQHLGLSRRDALERACRALETTQIAEPQSVIRRYPHQLSGGMQQRVMIAMALSTRPRLLVLDEPTTALDVTTQAVILDLVRALIKEEESAALYISHDLGTIAQLCDVVTVLYAGEVMETAPVEKLFAQPVHPYTIGLLASLPSAAAGSQSRLSTIAGVAPSLTERPHACVFASRCPVATTQCHTQKPPLTTTSEGHMVRCWRWEEIADGALTPRNPPQGKQEVSAPEPGYVLQVAHLHKAYADRHWLDRLMGKPTQPVRAVEDVSIRINQRATVGLVGESGSGKTTLARAIVGLETADSGSIELLDMPVSLRLEQRSKDILRNLRMVFQNPNDALNPYHTVGETIGRTMRQLARERPTQKEVSDRIADLLEAVGLTPAYAQRYPQQLSGGEKQRVAIARAFAAQPALIIADEPTSALDVSVQAVILNLLKDLRAQNGASYLFISHDLEVIRYLADWIVVMYLGEIVEQGMNEQVAQAPMHPYTEALLSAAPVPDPSVRHQRIRLEGDIPSPRQKPTGCPFHTRCPRYLGDICRDERPPLRQTDDGHMIRCHIPLDTLAQLQSGGTAP